MLVAAAGRAAAWLGEGSAEGVTEGLGTAMAPIGNGDPVDSGAALSAGAGMTVTTAAGEAVRGRRVGADAGASDGE
ncbi:MAG: hypothetical protein NVS3B26_13520 [Mycobacteriales bacterium]